MEPPADLQPSLEGDVKADVIVVGAGFAGLSTALELRALGAQVILLEQEFAGFGASAAMPATRWAAWESSTTCSSNG